MQYRDHCPWLESAPVFMVSWLVITPPPHCPALPLVLAWLHSCSRLPPSKLLATWPPAVQWPGVTLLFLLHRHHTTPHCIHKIQTNISTFDCKYIWLQCSKPQPAPHPVCQVYISRTPHCRWIRLYVHNIMQNRYAGILGLFVYLLQYYPSVPFQYSSTFTIYI